MESVPVIVPMVNDSFDADPLDTSHTKLSRLANVRPAAILPMQPTGVNRWLLAPLLNVIPALGISSVDLGRAMFRVGLDRSWHGSRTLENRDLRALLGEGQWLISMEK